MKRWKVEVTFPAEQAFRADFNTGRINLDDIRVFLKWVDEMEEFGPAYMQTSRNWNDHPLQGKWWGYRSSSFSFRGRIIYRIIEKRVVVEVVRITANHNYKK